MAKKRKTIHRLLPQAREASLREDAPQAQATGRGREQEGTPYKVSVHPTMRPAPHEVGYLVVIGEQLNHNGYVFVGWAPADERGLADLLTLVQYGYPGPLVVKGFKAATPYQVGELKKRLADYQVRTDDDNWYEDVEAVEAFLIEVIKTKEPVAELLEGNKTKLTARPVAA